MILENCTTERLLGSRSFQNIEDFNILSLYYVRIKLFIIF
jgi:hypothetical protein